MIILKKAIPRRTFLRGMGATVALPLLDAMVPSMTAFARTPARPVKRLGFVYMPMGCDLARWTPSGVGKITQWSPTLQSLAPVADQITIISNMELKNAYPGTHATSNASFLSAAKAKWTESTDYHLGTTVDQVAAQQMGQQTLLPSLEMSMDLLQSVGQCDNGYACVYQNNLSWSSPTTPLHTGLPVPSRKAALTLSTASPQPRLTVPCRKSGTVPSTGTVAGSPPLTKPSSAEQNGRRSSARCFSTTPVRASTCRRSAPRSAVRRSTSCSF